MEGSVASNLSHSPIHDAVLSRNYHFVNLLLSTLPPLSDPTDEASSIEEEDKAIAISSIIDSRDWPNRETPLHLAVKLADPHATSMLMAAGADWTLQNDEGWNALQVAIFEKKDNLAKIILRQRKHLAWAIWTRRLPRVIGSMRRMRDFYAEITFHFESSVIPFISRIAPSDTCKIWKRGSNLRADHTLLNFDTFRIRRSDRSVLFFGEGSEDGNLPPGSLCVISHKDRVVRNVSSGAGVQPSEREINQEISKMSKKVVSRAGIDVRNAILRPHMTWKRQERSEMVGPWKAKVYDMHHAVISMKSRRVRGVVKDCENLSSISGNEMEGEEYGDTLTEEERKLLKAALEMDFPDMTDGGSSEGYVEHRHNPYEQKKILTENNSCGNGERKQDLKSWIGNWRKKGNKLKHEAQKKTAVVNGPPCVYEKVSDFSGDSLNRILSSPERHLVEVTKRREDVKGVRDKDLKETIASSDSGHQRRKDSRESEHTEDWRPVLWLSTGFPLKIEELLPLLGVLGHKVKPIRRLRELLITKLPDRSFPVKVAFPVLPTIRVVVTFTKFEELQPSEEFFTPPLSPVRESSTTQTSTSRLVSMEGCSSIVEDIQDPFVIPSGYIGKISEGKEDEIQENKSKPKKGRGKNP